jgi:hypothetical protein
MKFTACGSIVLGMFAVFRFLRWPAQKTKNSKRKSTTLPKAETPTA